MHNFARHLGDLAGHEIVLWRSEITALEKRFGRALLTNGCVDKPGWLNSLRALFGWGRVGAVTLATGEPPVSLRAFRPGQT